jgi:hypothetical protein
MNWSHDLPCGNRSMLLQREGPDLCCGTRPPSRDVRVHGESWRVTGPSVGPFSRRPLRQKRIMKADDNGFLWSYLVETWPRAPPTSSTSSASSYARWRGLSAAGGDVDWRALLNDSPHRYSTTLSARSRNVSGIVKPSALAVVGSRAPGVNVLIRIGLALTSGSTQLFEAR